MIRPFEKTIGLGLNPRAQGTNPRALEINPKAIGTNPRARRKTSSLNHPRKKTAITAS